MAQEPITVDWTAVSGASPEEVERLAATVQSQLPIEYLDLVAKTNGGEGALAVRPGWFQLFDIEFALETWNDSFYRQEFPDYFFFGSNGGLESFVLVLRGVNVGSILAVDAIAGVESAFVVASSFREFTSYIGKPLSEA